MKVMERDVARLLAVQHLRSAYGIKIKNWNKNRSRSTTCNSTKVFGVPLESLPYYNMECGSVPSFLVDACMKLLAHIDTEGLFRKSGSVLRIKALRSRVDQEESCLSSALPCDVAGLVKQFFRDLPEPAVPWELQESFLKAQQLSGEEERTAATLLLSCVLPDRNLALLQYFFSFLHSVALRSSENKMDSKNLSVILAPNLLHYGDGATEKITANTEKRLRLQAAIVHCFIDNASSLGVLPAFLQEKVPSMLSGGETLASSPSRQQLEELDLNSGMKRKQRRSFGVFSSATPLAATPSSKRKLPLEAAHSFGFSNKKRRSVKKNLGLNLLPNPLFSGASTPGSVSSASGVLEASESLQSPAVRTRRHSASSSRRKSRRVSGRHVVSRVESGRSGCFSPKVKKEAPRKSLRLRFSLGKSSRDAGSESVGLRLASQESSTAFHFPTETEFSPSLASWKPPHITVSAGRSQSEENLLTPPPSSRFPVAAPRSAPSSPARLRPLQEAFVSEPIITVTGDAHLDPSCSPQSQEKKRECSPTPSRDLSPAPSRECSPAPSRDCPQDADGDVVEAPPTEPRSEHGESSAAEVELPEVTFGVLDVHNLTPLHITSQLLDSEESSGPIREEELEPVECSRLIEALDIQSPAHFSLFVSSTPLRPPAEHGEEDAMELATAVHHVAVPPPEDGAELGPEAQKTSPPTTLCSLEAERRRRVAEHIRHFNKLTLQSPRSAQKLRPPLNFQRTPVRQAVRRINSMMVGSRSRGAVPSQPPRAAHQDPAPPTSKKTPPPVPPKTTSLRARASIALGDVTNTVRTKTRAHAPDPSGNQQDQIRDQNKEQIEDQNRDQIKDQVHLKDQIKDQVHLKHQIHLRGSPRVQQDLTHYRGSPRNPLNGSRLLSATRPVDL